MWEIDVQYLVTGARVVDGWTFAGEVGAASPEDAATIVRQWGVEPDFVQLLETGEILRSDEPADAPADTSPNGSRQPGAGDAPPDRSR